LSSDCQPVAHNVHGTASYLALRYAVRISSDMAQLHENVAWALTHVEWASAAIAGCKLQVVLHELCMFCLLTSILKRGSIA
jgi:hypothetical protein